MLTDLTIRNLAVVEQAEIAFESGLTTLTGETGAGKSIIIQALLLVLGERASSETVRNGEKRGDVAAIFDLRDSPEALAWLQEQELDDELECQLRRTITADGRSKSYINGQPSPAGRVRELGRLLMDIHGQHEYQQLLKGDAQRALLDSFGGLNASAGKLADCYQAWRELDQRYTDLSNDQQDQSDLIELLNFQCQELQTLALEPGEWSDLQQQHQRARNGSRLLENCQQLTRLFDDDDTSIQSLMAAARQLIDPLREIDPECATIAQMIEEADIQITEASRSLRHYTDRLEIDPQQLAWLEERISAANSLARKHQCEPAQLPEQQQKLTERLEAIEQSDDRLAALQQEIETVRQTYDQLAAELSSQRQQAADELSTQVTATLRQLGMSEATLVIQLEPRPNDTPHPQGMEKISYLFSANPGMQPGQLGRIASGGELSRISLALQVCAQGQSSVPTLVFDEVDVGVGGAVAEIVGQLLNQLGQQRQVFCITHLPQVAAQGHQQSRISKSVNNRQTATQVEALSGEERVTEIARMLAGIELTDESLAHARQMLAHHL
ncbi:MAG: DNA repair protein RecN [Immundisolibacteraceae bacterium]|nr:DNA repair protein RecN [Immundisolibacteraceae bacterium]